MEVLPVMKLPVMLNNLDFFKCCHLKCNQKPALFMSQQIVLRHWTYSAHLTCVFWLKICYSFAQMKAKPEHVLPEKGR